VIAIRLADVPYRIDGADPEGTPPALPAYLADAALPVVKVILSRCFQFGFAEAAIGIVHAWTPAFPRDPHFLPWISSQLVIHRELMQPGLMGQLLVAISQISIATQASDTIDMLRTLVDADKQMARDPAILSSAYSSPYLQFLHVFVCLTLLRSADDIAVGSELATALSNDGWNPDSRQNVARITSHFAASLTPSISLKYFTNLASSPSVPVHATAARLFLVLARLYDLHEICRNCGALINGNPLVLEFFLDAIMPSACRLKGAPDTALLLISGILRNVGEGMSVELQHLVLDCVVSLVDTMDLHSEREVIISYFSPGAPGHFREWLGQCLAAVPSCRSPG
jgi:hypothetical protein